MMALMVAGAILIPVQLNRLGDLLAAHSSTYPSIHLHIDFSSL